MKQTLQNYSVRIMNATCRALSLPQYSAMYVCLVEVREESESFYTTGEGLQGQLIAIHQEALHAIGPAGRNLPLTQKPGNQTPGIRERLRAVINGAALVALALLFALSMALTLTH